MTATRKPGRPRGAPKTGGRVATGRMTGADVSGRLNAAEVAALDAMRDAAQVATGRRPSRAEVLRAPLVTAA